jgi:Fe-Mn family superoxide dismutase
MIHLPLLPYASDALAPHLSERTLRLHHGRHHARYVEMTNRLMREAGWHAETLEEVVVKAWRLSARALFNNAAQSFNHAFYWECMSPGRSRPSAALARVLERHFGDLAKLREAFIAEGAGHFGSGWVWLYAQHGKIGLLSTHDGDTVARMEGLTPLLVCDVWEHAYYVDHQNDRGAYLVGWWDNLVNWSFVERQLEASEGRGPAWRYPGPIDEPAAPDAVVTASV